MSAFGSKPPVRGALVPSMDQLSDVKLHPPSRRASWVDRPRLMEAMAQAVRRPVTLVAAPAGYGKTTVVAQALQGEGCPDSAWVSLDAGDNDPVRLWSHVAAALERAGCVLPLVEPSRVFGARLQAPPSLLATIMAALAAMPEDLVLITRSDPGLRLGRLRVSHDLAELRAEDLAFTPGEAQKLVAGTGVALSDDTLTELVERTEGW